MRTRTFLVALALCAMTGCAKTRISSMTKEQRDTTATVQQRLDRLRAEIDTLDRKSDVAGARARARLEHELIGLRAERDSAAAKLAILQSAGREAWASTKIETDRTLSNLEFAIAAARRHLGVDSLPDTTKYYP